MVPVVVHARAGVPPCGVEDLSGPAGGTLDRETLVAAGQALTWRSVFTSGSLTAIPLTAASAVIIGHDAETPPELWHDRFTRGFAHRMAGELTIASVTAGLLGETVSGNRDEDAKLLGSAIDGLARLLTDLEEACSPGEKADRIVADTVRTHSALLGVLAHQQVSARDQGEFTVHTVRSVARHLTRSDLEPMRARIGLPWPARVTSGVGDQLGLARWRATMQSDGDQMWCRLEAQNVLVTELWLRNPPEPRE
ncbi:hypothetical protein [Actinomadura coerulea]|uniref:Uncharacterized protein n=1 Tax=Actinomadura coerulea TaxID=46159 RepID=A0A7X0G7M8_9ACTN|nr:hypothetical protein [Actinomadura coerulea]MBB6400177.1 hypothetical protein [Actinomadura coerulea]GGQ22541.1 hypothetical protein GCM10010187_43800 [Actinomadura coerulea]